MSFAALRHAAEHWTRKRRMSFFQILEGQPGEASLKVLSYYIEEHAERCGDPTAALRLLNKVPPGLVRLRIGGSAHLRVAADDLLAYLEFPSGALTP